MASDFRAIDDLASRRPPGQPESPAHFGLPARRREIQMWKDGAIEVLSYVTLGKRPFPFDADGPAPPWELAKPWTYPEVSKDCALSEGTDIVYRTCYRACAGGPFERPAWNGEATRRVSAAAREEIALWDNDGIVNTLSMFWPEGENVVVSADHMDIVGHYKPVPAPPGGGRALQAYDLLESASGFCDTTFQEVWNDIFAFCAGRRER
jgi:triacylglycerol lipase